MQGKLKSALSLAIFLCLIALALNCGPAEIRVRPTTGLREFHTDFDESTRLSDFSNDWTVQLQQPDGNTDFVVEESVVYSGENRIELQSDQSRSGSQAFKFTAPASGKKVSKAAIQKGGFFFEENDDFWVAFWLFVEGDGNLQNLFLFDLETNQLKGSPGRRLMCSGGDAFLKVESKSSGPDFSQEHSDRTALPKNQWVHIVLHIHLAHNEIGEVELWQDRKKILYGKGQTLPKPNIVYDRVQFGITASGPHSGSLFIDDVMISDKEIAR